MDPDDVILTDITDNEQGQLTFTMHIQVNIGTGVLSAVVVQETIEVCTLLYAFVLVEINNYTAAASIVGVYSYKGEYTSWLTEGLTLSTKLSAVIDFSEFKPAGLRPPLYKAEHLVDCIPLQLILHDLFKKKTPPY